MKVFENRNLKVVRISFIAILATMILISCGFLISCGSLITIKSQADNSQTESDEIKSSETNSQETSSPKTNSNDYQIQISSLKSQLADVKNELNEIKFENKKNDLFIAKLQDQIKVLEKKNTYYTKNQTKNLTPLMLYKRARNLLIEEDFIIAADLFIEFSKNFPGHEFADNAAYWLGECYYSLKKFQKSITVFKSLVKKYPKSDKVPGALLKTGFAYLSLADPNRAHHYLTTVLKQYPFSPAAEKAQEKLKNFE